MAWNDDLITGTPTYNLAANNAHTIRAVAGPGSGKTFGIKRRIARFLESSVKPEKILSITFTRNAAADLKREIFSLGIPGAENVHSRTLHSHALQILMRAEVFERTGRTPRMVIDHEIMPALRDIEGPSFPGIKEKKHLLKSYLAAWARLQNDTPGFVKDKTQELFENALISWLTRHDGILVGEVIPVAIEYLRNNPASMEINRYKVILVDEYQDLNRSEQEFIRLIRGEAEIVIVGDDDQSIYGFKFAHPEGIREIGNLHGHFEDIPFSECWRCPKQVTRMASALISKNPNRTLGDLIQHRTNPNGRVQIIQWSSYDEEILGIPYIISEELEKGILQPADILVLAPRRKIGYKLRDNLISMGFPVKSYFRESAIDKDTVKRAYSLLYLLANPNDIISLRFLLGYGSQDCRRNQYSELWRIAQQNNISLIETIKLIDRGEIESRCRTIITEYHKILDDLKTLKDLILQDPKALFTNMFIKSPEDENDFFEIIQLYQNAIDDTGLEEIENKPENFDIWFKKVFAIVQEALTIPDSPENIDHIRIMSLHSSKGLSAKFVILCSMIDNLIPFIAPNLDENERQNQLQEQRRLFYVALTRCKATNEYQGRLIISSFTSIYGLDAVRMNISANPEKQLRVSSTRFLRDFGPTSPEPVLGTSIISFEDFLNK